MKDWRDLYAGFLFCEQAHGFRQEVNCLSDHQTDRNIIFIFRTEILALFNGPLHLFPHIGKVSHKLDTGWRQGCAFSVAVKDRKTDFFFQQPDLIGKSRLACEHVFRCTAEIQGTCQFYAIVDLFCCHYFILLLFKF